MCRSGPQARGEKAERRNQKTAVHAEKLIPMCGSQLEGASGLGRRNEINHEKEVGRAVSQGASYESENPAVNSIPAQLVQDRRFACKGEYSWSMGLRHESVRNSSYMQESTAPGEEKQSASCFHVPQGK